MKPPREVASASKSTLPRAILACAARHLFCAAGDLAVGDSTSPSDRVRLEAIKGRLRPLLVRDATVAEFLAASPRIVTAASPSWTLLEAIAAVLSNRRAQALDEEIDPSVVELAAHYLKGVQWALPDELRRASF